MDSTTIINVFSQINEMTGVSFYSYVEAFGYGYELAFKWALFFLVLSSITGLVALIHGKYSEYGFESIHEIAIFASLIIWLSTAFTMAYIQYEITMFKRYPNEKVLNEIINRN